MKSWNRPEVPALPGTGFVPTLWDTATAGLLTAQPESTAGLYVCGITPYDATHIGHAATYLAYDTVIRLWLDAGFDVTYVQNTTDVDDPLLERANERGVDWRDLAEEQTDRFRGDMQALSIIPPDHYIAVTERVTPIADAVDRLVERGIGYYVETDVYFDSAAAAMTSPWHLGGESNYDRELMLRLSAERGGDPDRPGKRDPLDPILWRGARDGEPSWPSPLGDGRPGWHIECSIIAAEFLELPFTVQGGGSDLIFPHHEFSAGHTAAISGHHHAQVYSHAGLVRFEGEKMSKSLGNLVFVDALLESGTDPRAIRLALLSQHYREDWEWMPAQLDEAVERLDRWRVWAVGASGTSPGLLDALRVALADDLDSPRALRAVDEAVASGAAATATDVDAIHALLGVDLR